MNEITIATHNGSFHADDVFSIAALKSIYPSFKLIRTRDPELITKADIVVDVGGIHDAQTDRFDHHQRGGGGERANGIPFSSFSLSQTISMFNPTWQEDSKFDEAFDEAVEFAARLLARFIAAASGGINAKSIVAKAVEQATDPRVIVLEQYTPWKKTVHSLSSQALYVIYPSQSEQWMIQTVPAQLGSFEDRQPLPKPWSGLSGKELQDVTGIEDATFCHNGLFIAGANSLDSIMKMAALALDQ